MTERPNLKNLYHSDIWEDEEPEVKNHPQDEPAPVEEDFSKLLAGESSRTFDKLRPGDAVTGKVISVGTQAIFVDIGQRSEAVADRGQFTEEEIGKIKVGDKIQLFVASISSAGIDLAKTVRMKDLSKDKLYEALNSGVPIEGKVSGENKGGYTVDIPGGKGFVPFSQMDAGARRGASEYIGKTLRFRITQIKGRDVVLSRAALQREEQAEERSRLLGEIEPDQVRPAVVVKREKFGVFVDLGGGLHALVPVSELSWSRTSDALDQFQPGDQLQVKILSVDGSGPKPRIAASLKQLGGDPWDLRVDEISVGSSMQGQVTRLAPFGAFVELQPGLEGLVHISEMSAKKRVNQPGEICQVGDKVSVRILAIDRIERRIRLTLKTLEDEVLDQETKSKYLKEPNQVDNEHRGVELRDDALRGTNAFAQAFQKANQRK